MFCSGGGGGGDKCLEFTFYSPLDTSTLFDTADQKYQAGAKKSIPKFLLDGCYLLV